MSPLAMYWSRVTGRNSSTPGASTFFTLSRQASSDCGSATPTQRNNHPCITLGTGDRVYEPPLHHGDPCADIAQAEREVDDVRCGLDRSAPAGDVHLVAVHEADGLGAGIVVRLQGDWASLL